VTAMESIPDVLRTTPFTSAQAVAAGMPKQRLRGRRFVQVHPRVWRCSDHEMTHLDHITAARLAMPADAHLTGVSRIQALGLDFGPRRPIRFVVARDHHIALDGIFLHRTRRLPPTDGNGVTVAAAFIAYCALARVIDAIKVGDWLVHHGHMTVDGVRALALAELWRPGAGEAIWVLDHLDGRSRSLRESETRSVLEFAGLVGAEVNAELVLSGGLVLTPDLRFARSGVVVEYEGRQHQEDRGQYSLDIDRYAAYRRDHVPYVLVTSEALARPRRMVRVVHEELVRHGYDGPAPSFAHRWALLFASVAVAAGPKGSVTDPWRR
jgi:hypothetical protein